MRFEKNTSTYFASQLNYTYNYTLQKRPKYSVIFYLVTRSCLVMKLLWMSPFKSIYNGNVLQLQVRIIQSEVIKTKDPTFPSRDFVIFSYKPTLIGSSHQQLILKDRWSWLRLYCLMHTLLVWCSLLRYLYTLWTRIVTHAREIIENLNTHFF